MSELADHIHGIALEVLDGIPHSKRGDVYAVSFFVYDQDDDPRKPTITIGFNTETYLAESGSPGDEEARWNYAFWPQNQLAIIFDGDDDRPGARTREAWIRDQGLWFEVAEDDDPFLDSRGQALTDGFVSAVVDVVRRLHGDGDIERIFGRPVPVLIHELEYYDQIADQNVAANPRGLVDDFARFCRGV